MSIALKFERKRNFNWRILRKFFSVPGRLLLWVFETVADLADTRVFQLIRLLAAGAVIWFLVNGLQQRSGSGGLDGVELIHYGKAAVIAALVGIGVSVVWSSSLCDGLAGIIMHIIDDPDDRPIKEDPMDKVRRLIDRGKISRARRLCKRMLRRKEGSPAVLGPLIEHLEYRRKNPAAQFAGRAHGGK